MKSRNSSVTVVESGLATVDTLKQEQCNADEVDLSPQEQRKIMRKIDFRVTVVLGIINCMSLMDRGNLAAAAVAGMNEDLDLQVGHRYSIVALIFFVPYLIFEFISSILARKVGSRRLLVTICTLWGIVMIGTGLVKTWQQLAALRVLLGSFEAAFFPVVVHLLSAWYTRYEVHRRYALFFLITASVTSFGGILAFGFTRMNGVGGINGWRWTFIMEGIFTLVFGVAAASLVVDFPDKARSSFKFLTDQQVDWVVRRLQQDRGDADPEPFSWSKFFGAGCHLPIWFYATIFCCCTSVVHGVSFFLPLILNHDMGFDVGASLCLLAPPYLFGALMMLVSGWVGDKYRIRGPILVGNAIVAIVGLILLGWTKPSSTRYFSIFVINGGVLPNIPTAMAYSANNIRGQWVRAFGSAALVVGGGLGGVFGSLLFSNGSTAASRAGICGCIAANVLIILLVSILTMFFKRQNELVRQGRKVIQGRPGFMYSI